MRNLRLVTQTTSRSTWNVYRTIIPLGIAGAVLSAAALAAPGKSASAPSVLSDEHLPHVYYADLWQMKEALDAIRHELNDDNVVSTDPNDLLAHGFAEWSSINIETLPVAVAYPRSTSQVATIVKICHEQRIPLIPFSGGSSLEAHTSAPYGGISIDFAHMDAIVALHKDDMNVVVQPGLSWTDLNDHLANEGCELFFPIDPAPSAKIGGMVGTNCSGTNAVRYGTMRDWVVNLTVVLADGSIIKTRQRPRKSSAGYNLTGLIVGSEGTLGLVTEATLKLASIPEHYSVAVVPFKSIEDAVSAATSVVRKGIPISAVELMDEVQMRVVNRGGMTRPRIWKESPTLFFKFAGTRASVEGDIRNTREVLRAFGPGKFEFAKDAEEMAVLWSARKESLYSLLALREPGEELWTTDVAVPLSRLAEIVQASKEEAGRLGLKASVKGHVGDGNFHENITYDKTNPEEVQRASQAVKNMVERAVAMDGTCTGEHGIGLGKKAGLLQEVGEDTVLAMKLLKTSLDPRWIMNPGKIFDI